MQNFTASQVTDWINNTSPKELIPVVKQALSKIATLPANERDQFSRDISNDQSVSKLFKTEA